MPEMTNYVLYGWDEWEAIQYAMKAQGAELDGNEIKMDGVTVVSVMEEDNDIIVSTSAKYENLVLSNMS